MSAVSEPMFCYQCEQTAHNTGCTTIGICGKEPETAALQDVMVHIVKGLSQYATRLRQLGDSNIELNDKTLEALFMTLTNVNFDTPEHITYVHDLSRLLAKTKTRYEDLCGKQGQSVDALSGPAQWNDITDDTTLLNEAIATGIVARSKHEDKDVLALQEMLIYGIKGLAAYAHHARLLGYSDEKVFAFVHDALDYTTQPEQSLDKLLALCLKAGEINYVVMELLDRAHTESFGHPVPTSVRTTPIAGKCILVSGHDMKALYELLKQTESTGINVYTHGEMLPAHGYPCLHAFSHLVANYGGAWQNQVTEFADFPGPILMTTNCLKPPADTYKERLYTIDVVGFSGLQKIQGYDYTPLIEKAQQYTGFNENTPEKSITVGFARNAVLGVADQVIDAVKAGKIKHFFLIGGCDGAEYGRNYFTDFADSAPQDTVIMTLGCGKYRFNMHEFGDIGGIPRLLDLGQCNDAYSAVQIATALAGAFECNINELPLSLIISWFEQKAVAVLLTLLHLGVKNIRLGPNLPAFITPNVLDLLVKTYDLKPITTAKEDLQAIGVVAV